MANAWCINAIWFDWTLIQTLQQLDSSNIWVWVQYCAPNPLDDKRFDYIKYTDKCGCTCCLTWENEIMIYATQWVIKNLTLTNDDTNEVVNVKRTDLFWSNRKKTVVRYKTWWYPTSITDWTLAVEETTMNQYQSSWYNVSWLSDATTYYFTAFAVAQDDTIIVVQSWNITTNFTRKPWINTVAYRPLTSSSMIQDMSWNNKNLTDSWSVSFWLYQWIDCAYFNWSNHLYNTNVYSNQNALTVMWFLYFVNFSSWYDKNIFRRWNNLWPRIESYQNILHCSPWLQQSISVSSDSGRLHYAFTYDWSWTLKFYVNATLIWTNSSASPPSSTWIRISRSYQNNNSFTKWWQSEIIVEKVVRTQEEIAAYLNKLKSKYWIS